MEHCVLGIVGPGIIWDFAHSRALQEVGSFFEIGGFCATSERSRRKVADAYPGMPFYFDYRELLKRPEIDGVVVMTPIPLNASYTIMALEAGKHVFVEKPMATSGEDAVRIIEAERRSAGRVFVMEQVRYKTIWTRVREVLAEELIGTPVYFDMLSHSLLDAEEHDSGGAGKRSWRIESDFPLGTLFDGGIHKVAEFTGLFGSPGSVYALGASCRDSYGAYDHVVMSLGFPDGLNGTFSHSGFLGGDRDYFHIRGTEGLLSIDAPNVDTGTISIEPKVVPKDASEGVSTRTMEIPAEFPHTNMWRHFMMSLRQNTGPAYSTDDARRDIRILEAADESLTKGTVITIE